MALQLKYHKICEWINMKQHALLKARLKMQHSIETILTEGPCLVFLYNKVSLD